MPQKSTAKVQQKMHIRKIFWKKVYFWTKKFAYGLHKATVASRWASVARSVPSKLQHCHSTLGHSPHIRIERVSVVWAASCDRNFGGMLENSFEHSEIELFPTGRCPKVLKILHICKYFV